jgi:DNA replication protein DnaC
MPNEDLNTQLVALEAASHRALRALAAERQGARQTHLEQSVGRCGVPPRFLGKTFDTFRAEGEAQIRAVNLCRRYTEDFPRVRRQGHCLLLVGAPGTGKTHLACAVLQQVIRQGYTGLFTGMAEALRMIRSTYSAGARLTEIEAFALYTRPDLLVVDEVGVAIGDDDKRRAMLFDLLNARYGEVKPTVLIGNLTVEELERYLGERVMDRLLEAGSLLVPFTWASYRRRPVKAA